MAKSFVSVLKYVGSLGLAGVLLYFAFRNVNFSEFLEKAKTVDYTWVIVSILLSFLSYAARAYRWNILLKPMGHDQLTTSRTTVAVLIGYLANLAFPRLGEVTRCGMLKRSDDVPISSGLGTVITERIIDLFSLVFLIFIALIMEYDRLLTFLGDLLGLTSGGEAVVELNSALFWKLGLGLLVIAGIILGLFLLARNTGGKVKEFIRQLYEGVISLRKIDNLFGFIASTIVLWVVYYFMSYLIVFSLPETSHLSWVVGIMLLVTGGIALAIPVQGGFGTYHTLISAMLALYAVEETTGVFLATLLHTSQVVAIAVFGGISLLISVFMKRKVNNNLADESEKATATN